MIGVIKTKNEKLFITECKKLKIPKYIQQIVQNDLILANTEVSDSYLLHHSKHATIETLRWRYDKLVKWIVKNGGIVLEDKYNYDKEYCGVREKFYPFRFRFPCFKEHAVIFSFVGYK